MELLKNIEPKGVFRFFESISNIPRASGKEKAISDFMVNYAKEKGFSVLQDSENNVIVKKPATKGYENAPTIILQGHLDIVCEKNAATIHDFDNEPIKLILDGDIIRADGTTLGADNGIGVAMALAIIDSDEYAHPALEIIMTTNEEVGMDGAAAIDASQLKGEILLNLDSEEEGILLSSCAGGMTAVTSLPFEYVDMSADLKPFAIKIRGLNGGHSGVDIHKERANANILLGRILNELVQKFSISMAEISGGLKENAITRESQTIICVNPSDVIEIKNVVENFENCFKNEYRVSDFHVCVLFEPLNEKISKAFDNTTMNKIIQIMMLTPQGIQNMSLDIKGLVESSNNLGIIKTEQNKVTFTCAVRSAIDTRKYLIMEQLKLLATSVGASFSTHGVYPGWEYNPDSKIRKICVDIYKDFYKAEPKIEAIHAGLECGIFAEKIKNLDIISLGPDAWDIHTPEERISIASTKRTFEYLIKILENIK